MVLTFLEVGAELESVPPGLKLWAELEMAHLVHIFHFELIAIAQDPVDDAERQVRLWLHNLAALPPRASLRCHLKWLNAALSRLPRPKGSPVLEPARYAWARGDVDSATLSA